MNEMVERMALWGQEEREKMLQWYGETMPKGISSARRETGVLHVFRSHFGLSHFGSSHLGSRFAFAGTECFHPLVVPAMSNGSSTRSRDRKV